MNYEFLLETYFQHNYILRWMQSTLEELYKVEIYSICFNKHIQVTTYILIYTEIENLR